MSDGTPRYTIFETADGHCGLAWRGEMVVRIALPSPGALSAERYLLRRLGEAERAVPPPPIAAVVEGVTRYFAGETVDFSGVALDIGPQDALMARIYDATRRLGRGETTTYGALAKSLGEGPEVAREVGQAMARNPIPLIIPCHRVLAAGGKVGGFSAPGGAETKVRMLALEGVNVAPPAPVQLGLGF